MIKFNGALFHQTPEENRARLGDRFDPSREYPAYNGSLEIPAEVIPELVDYLTAAQPDDRGRIRLNLAGWKRTSQTGKVYLSLQGSDDYKTKKAIEAARAAAPAAQPAPTSVGAVAQQLAQNFGGHAVPAEDTPF